MGAWRARGGRGLPLAVEATAALLDARLRDAGGGLPAGPARLLYSMAVVRLVSRGLAAPS